MLRLCAGDWKAYQIGIDNYCQWPGWPKSLNSTDTSIEVKKEVIDTSIKWENTHQAVAAFAIKRTQKALPEQPLKEQKTAPASIGFSSSESLSVTNVDTHAVAVVGTAMSTPHVGDTTNFKPGTIEVVQPGSESKLPLSLTDLVSYSLSIIIFKNTDWVTGSQWSSCRSLSKFQ